MFADWAAGVVVWGVVGFVGAAGFEVTYRVVILDHSALVHKDKFMCREAEYSADVSLEASDGCSAAGDEPEWGALGWCDVDNYVCVIGDVSVQVFC